ncbi:reprolysin-like metallopeptidase [Nocardioides sp. C4-1]|uniref:reprolysin-like metallopeptidase n=1 Tax=Nocardioides sp. C4-1 TaxID=3151851 RepID=UPI0032672CB3
MPRVPARLAAATAVVLAAGLLPVVTSSPGAVAADPVFRPVPSFKPSGDKVRVAPSRFSAVRVDLAQVRAQLKGAKATVDVPTPSGGMERFEVTRSDVLAPEIAREHPEIAAFEGRSVSDPTTTIALDVTPMGFHAAVRGPQGQGSWYVDPAYDKAGTTTHLSFYGSATTRPEEQFAERQAPEIRRAAARRGDRAQLRAAKPGGAVVEKRYRLALVSDPTYAAYFGTDNVLAEKATLINRVNQIYGQDLAIRLQLINETDELNFDTAAKATLPDGPCGGEPCYRSATPGDEDDYGDLDFCSGRALARNRVVLGQVVGASNYDVGHLALGVNGGGIAYLGVVGADYKGGGCTGLPQPQGDFFAIDYVAHELGHQFAGNHTFDGVQNACSGGNRNGATSVEPGSGSSVMAYAGICLQDDLQPHTDPYFSWQTLDEVNRYTGRPTARVVEVQTVSLSGFGAPGSSFQLGFGDAEPVTISADDYTAASVEAAVEGLVGQDVTIAGWAYDPYGGDDVVPYPAPLTPPGPTGFQVIFAPTAKPDEPGNHQDEPSLTVSAPSAGVSGFVGEVAKGGPADNGGTGTATTGNRAPRVVEASIPRTIPVRTPFKLSGRATDPDGDPLTYLWEQADRGLEARGTSLVSNRKIYGPLFRVFGTRANVTDAGTLESPSPGINIAGRSGTRFFPDLAQVLSGNTNARTGTCPKVAPPPEDLDLYKPPSARVVDCYSEYLPTKGYLGTQGAGARVMHFRLTVRDGRGGVAYRNTKLRIAKSAGPFKVVSQSRKGLSVRAGSTIGVTWRVNGTKALSKRVRVLLSTDGGRTWNRRLTRATANDGFQRVTLPRGVRTTKARIVVEAAGSYFYAVSNRDFRIR